MKKGPNGSLRPEPNFLKQYMEAMPELQKGELAGGFEVIEFDPIIDSSNMDPGDWALIARKIKETYEKFVGYVVIMGTDTMAYCATALSFMLENLGKPVVLTGAMIPISAAVNDARRNLINSVLIAGSCEIPEVLIFFNEHLLRGNRSVKVDSWGLDAFESPNFRPLGVRGVDMEIDVTRVLPQPMGQLRVHTTMCTEVAVLRLVPGFDDRVVANLVKPPLKGLVLQTYGTGNAPDRKADFLEILKGAIESGVVVVITSQCLRSKVELDQYATGKSLQAIGVISGEDMTTEAAAVKLALLLGMNLKTEEVRRLMGTNIRGELGAAFMPRALKQTHMTFNTRA